MSPNRQHSVLVVDDDAGQRSLLSTFLTQQGFSVSEAASGDIALASMGQALPDIVVSDVRMRGMSGLDLLRAIRENHPALPVLLVTAFADIRDAVGAMRDGAVDYLEKPIDFVELAACVSRTLGVTQEGVETDPPDVPFLPDDVVAESPSLRRILQEAAIVAQADSRVLITGESGTGKEVIADLIHRWSKRASGPIVTVNCAAIPENLLESELFGHEKGAFTGAHQRRTGRFEQADGGTIFLDEIGEMSPGLQAKLLRVIQDGTFERVGSSKSLSADVRVVAATNRRLEDEVQAGTFREDLYYRLNVIELHIPPLRERPEDILPLAELFARRYAADVPRFSPATLALLPVYAWPGNVRELQNAIERATLMARGGIILPDHFPRRIQESAVPTPSSDEETASEGRMARMERILILQTLREKDYNRTETAQALGISRRALTYKLRDLKEAGLRVDP